MMSHYHQKEVYQLPAWVYEFIDAYHVNKNPLEAFLRYHFGHGDIVVKDVSRAHQDSEAPARR